MAPTRSSSRSCSTGKRTRVLATGNKTGRSGAGTRNSSIKNAKSSSSRAEVVNLDVAWAELLHGEILNKVINFFEMSDWISTRRVCKLFSVACDQARFLFWSVLSSGAAKQQGFIARFATNTTKLDLSYCRHVQETLLSSCPHLTHLRAMSLPGPGLTSALLSDGCALESLEVLNAGSLQIKLKKHNANLRCLTLRNAVQLSDYHVRALIGNKLEKLCLDAPNVQGRRLLAAIAKDAPPLRVLKLKNVEGVFGVAGRELAACLSSVAATLHTLDISHSPGIWFPDVALPNLEVLCLDRGFVKVGQILPKCPKLRVLSLAHSDVRDSFLFSCNSPEDTAQGVRHLQKLEAVSLKSTRISDETVDVLSALPSMKVILLDSCRSVSRRLRLEIGKRNAEHVVKELAPELTDSDQWVLDNEEEEEWDSSAAEESDDWDDSE